MHRTSVYTYESNEVNFARLLVRLCTYANVHVKNEVYFGLNVTDKILLSDNGLGVLLSTAAARLPNRTGTGLCFASLRQITPCA